RRFARRAGPPHAAAPDQHSARRATVGPRASHCCRKVWVVVALLELVRAAVDHRMSGGRDRVDDWRLERVAAMVGPDSDLHCEPSVDMTCAYTRREMSAMRPRATDSSGMPRVSTTNT